MTATGLTVESVRAGYAGGPDVLHGLSLEVVPEELVVVLGRNGAGKTTLLRAISGLIRCREGRITLGDTTLSGLRADRVARAGVAHVPEGRRVIPGMSVGDNLRLGAFTMKKDAMEAQFDEVVDLFPALKERVDQAGGALSGGQQQMLAIARALMSRPRLVLLDEPLTGLAPVIQESVMEVLDGLRSQDRCILLVEQNAQRSLAIADRALILSEGRVTLEGTAESLANDPRVKEGYLGTRRPGTSAPAHNRSRRGSNV